MLLVNWAEQALCRGVMHEGTLAQYWLLSLFKWSHALLCCICGWLLLCQSGLCSLTLLPGGLSACPHNRFGLPLGKGHCCENAVHFLHVSCYCQSEVPVSGPLTSAEHTGCCITQLSCWVGKMVILCVHARRTLDDGWQST